MEEGSALEPRAKRQKRDKPQKFAAFEKLKQLKGSKHKYEVSDVDNVYEVVDEKEYTKRVLTRQDDDWIVDDDGSGYIEDGRDIFDDDLDADSIAAAAASAKDKGNKKKKKAVSEQAGKGNLQYLLSSMPSKKKEEAKLGEDDILSELISELDETNTQSVSHSRTPQRPTIKPKPLSGFTLSAEKKAAKDYLSSFSAVKSKKSLLNQLNSDLQVQKQASENNPEQSKEPPAKQQYIGERPSQKIFKEIQASCAQSKISSDSDDDIVPQTPTEKQPKSTGFQSKNKICEEEKNLIIEEFQTQEDMLNDEFDVGEIEEFSTQEIKNQTEIKNDVTEEQLLSGWETMQEGTINNTQIDINVDRSQIPMVTNEEGQEVFRFFWWDAYENAAIRPGEILLFGKTWCETVKSYVSCCVIVRNIERTIYLLPRTHHLDSNQKPTEQPVALIDVYHEFNNVYAPSLVLQSFKSRKVTKNYCFDPEVPTNSEYLEVKYAGKNPRLQPDVCKMGGKTFSKVFGNRSSFLEIFLLDRKIKGPCWLDISSPQPVHNPMSYCKFEVNCLKPTDINIVQARNIPPPPLLLATINMRTAINTKNMNNEIVMISFLIHTKYAVDKKPPNPMFEQHFCVFTKPSEHILPYDIHEVLNKFKATKVQKMDSERALLNYFVSQIARLDPDLVVGHDLLDYQIGLLCDRLFNTKTTNFSRLSRIKRYDVPGKRSLARDLFVGRLVCDVKISAKELIKSRSFNLDALCQTVLKMKEGERTEIEIEDVPKFYQTSGDVLKLISLTMQDTAYILKMMYELNVVPLALQITTIAGNVMSRTLLGGRSERNEFLLLHAFSEKNYIVPDKKSFKDENDESESKKSLKSTGASKKKPAYLGGLVLDPQVGFYDKLILLMDFNSLYPSIIQEYNICFTTIPYTSEDEMVLPDSSSPLGILPTEIRKLVESRREVKKLMKNPDLSLDLQIQYNIRQTALKLTANSMYGCLGFTNSRFYAKNLAALVTHKGREILTNTKDLVQKHNYQVIYGDTDSIMINTNCLEYDEVMKIGNQIKQEVNKLYKQVELDIDGVFKYLLLLKKKKYAAVTLSKDKNGEITTQQEHKGLDIVRRDWSQLAASAGRFTLDNILTDQAPEERIENIHAHLVKLKEDLEQNKVPLSLLVITKQLTKDPKLYPNKNQLPHVQVALRYNKRGGRILRAGDTVPYIICDDGTNAPATQRAYHIEELKNSETLKIDIKYYLAQQIHPVVIRLCEPLEGTDAYQIANCLGLDTKSFKKPIDRNANRAGEDVRKKINKFVNVLPFIFNCITCNTEIKVTEAVTNGIPFLMKCANPECIIQPIEYLPFIRNQLTLRIRDFIHKYYRNELTCEDPACTNDTIRLPLQFVGRYPVCTLCKKGVMYKKYTESDLYNQLSYYQHIFDKNKLDNAITDIHLEGAYHSLKETVEKTLKHSGFAVINLTELFDFYLTREKSTLKMIEDKEEAVLDYEENYDYDFDE